MIKIKRFFNFLICFLFLSLGSSGEKLKILTFESPPTNFVENGNLTGITVDFVKAIQKYLNDTSKIEIYPLARARDVAYKEPNVILFTLTRDEASEDKFFWISQVTERRHCLYAKKDFPKINSFNDLKNYTIGVMINDVRERILKAHGITKMELVSAHRLNIQKLNTGRIDLMATSKMEFEKLCQEEQIDKNNFKDVFDIYTAKSYICMSKKTDASIVENWTQAAEILKRNGTYEKIAKKWIKYMKDTLGANCVYKDEILYFDNE